MIETNVETFSAICDELPALWQAHFDEAAEDRDAIPLDMDVARYAALDAAGFLLIVTARKGGALVGYVFGLVGPTLQSKGVPQAVSDLHYLAPQCRGGRTAMRLFEAFEDAARARGAARLMIGTSRAGRLLSALGFRPIEVTYSKVIAA